MNSINKIEIKNDLKRGRGYVYSLQYHIVWCTKYRKKILENGLDDEIKNYLLRLAKEYEFTILAMEIMPDHVHILVDCKPQFNIPEMVKLLKSLTSRWFFKKHPEYHDILWGGHLWNPSYCVVTVSDRSIAQVKEYIYTQKTRP